MLNHCRVSESHLKEENDKLVRIIEFLRSDPEAFVAKNRVLSDSNSAVIAQLQDCKERSTALEFSHLKDANQHKVEVEQLKHLILNAEEEIDCLLVSKEELEIILIVLKDKLDDQCACAALQKEHSDELMILHIQCNELIKKLSEQVLKTEEFRNLSIHLRELKDKADNECIQEREKREPEGPTFAMQESLRNAFIKEQYESELQEVRQQLSISNKHGEEMLWKLQDTLDEIENCKKSKASQLRRNEELARKILELEAELQSVLSDKHDGIKGYDRITAELDCALLSLECCKEEKEKLEAALQEFRAEKAKLEAELTLVKAKIEKSASLKKMQNEENSVYISCGLSVVKNFQEILRTVSPSHETIMTDTSTNVSGGVPSHKQFDQGCLMAREVEEPGSILTGIGEISAACTSAQPVQLEKMKNENLLVPQDRPFNPDILGFQKELMQLQKVNEELKSIFPSFNEYPGSGNALERVLALEVELAEALCAKKK